MKNRTADMLPNRRHFLIGTAAALTRRLIVSYKAVQAAHTIGNRKRVLRMAHLTDTHIQPERGAAAGVALALKHLRKLDHPPALILIGGDSIMDSFGTDRVRADVQWELWKQVFLDECTLPVRSCLGSHDIWG